MIPMVPMTGGWAEKLPHPVYDGDDQRELENGMSQDNERAHDPSPGGGLTDGDREQGPGHEPRPKGPQ